MSVYQVKEPVHLVLGSLGVFDFEAGPVTAASREEEAALDHLCAIEHAELVERSDPPKPESEEPDDEPGPEHSSAPADLSVPPGSPPADASFAVPGQEA